MQLRNDLGLAKQLKQRLPDHLIKSIRAHASRVAFDRSTTIDWLSAFALIVIVFVLLALARLAEGDHGKMTFTAFDERPEQVTV
jgi:hypothetical protein